MADTRKTDRPSETDRKTDKDRSPWSRPKLRTLKAAGAASGSGPTGDSMPELS